MVEVGPRPKPPTNYSMTNEEILDAGSDELGAWVKKVYHLYSARFEGRVSTMFSELAAEDQTDPELNAAVQKQFQSAESVQTIAERLLVLSSRLGHL